MDRVRLLVLAGLVTVSACGQEAESTTGAASETGAGSGDGDGDPDSASGDGDGDGDRASGDGDGDGDSAGGDGDGDPSTGDGDGEPATSGDGDGEPATTGDGDGDGDGGGDGDGDGDGLPGCDEMTLVSIGGEVFTPSPEQPQLELAGGPFPPLRRIEIDLDVHVGPFRDGMPVDPQPNWTPRWDHIIYELFRDNQAQSWERFLLGASGRIETNAADRAFNYGRVELAPGAMSYISWKKSYPWMEDSDVHLRQWIDADLDQQTLEIWVEGELAWTITGDVAYYEPAMTTDGLYMHLGTLDADWGLHVSPYGWTFSNLRVCAWAQ